MDELLLESWKIRNGWAAAARAGKRAQESARSWALGLGVLGAGLGAIAAPAVAPEGVPEGLLAIVAAFVLAIAAYFGREFLTTERETAWAEARAVAEAIARECWRCAAAIPPYDADDRASKLATSVSDLTKGVSAVRASSANGSSPPPEVGAFQDYIDNRATEQAGWYEKRAEEHERKQGVFRVCSVVLGVVNVLLGVVGSSVGVLLTFVPVATTATAAVVALLQAGRFASMVRLYRATADQLNLEVARFQSEKAGKSGAELRTLETKLVQSCEEIMTRENEAWRAEWLTKEEIQKILQLLELPEQQAQADPGDQAPTI